MSQAFDTPLDGGQLRGPKQMLADRSTAVSSR